MYSTHTAELPIPSLPKEAKTAHIFPDLHHSLLAVAPLCDSGCTVTFTNTRCTIQLPNGNTIQCPQNHQGLWTLPQEVLHSEQDNTIPQAHTVPQVAAPAINRHSNTQANLVTFAHAALFSPAVSTLKQALRKGFLPPFVGLTETSLHRYPPSLEATSMGHLDAHRKNTNSTKKHRTIPATEEDDAFPPQPQDTTCTHTCFLATAEPRNIVYTDQTGRLPQPSSQGNNYLMIAYDYDSNNIMMRPIKNRSAPHSRRPLLIYTTHWQRAAANHNSTVSTTNAPQSSNSGSTSTTSNTN